MAEPLEQIIAQALMPSVMISAGAVIMQGIWVEHREVGQRLRSASVRLRDPSVAKDRRANVARQLLVLRRRLRLSRLALKAIYAALASFLIITLTIAVRGPQMAQVGLRIMFVVGVALMFVAVTIVLWEVRLAGASIDLELEEHEPLLELHA
jgi:hypothetical protein